MTHMTSHRVRVNVCYVFIKKKMLNVVSAFYFHNYFLKIMSFIHVDVFFFNVNYVRY